MFHINHFLLTREQYAQNTGQIIGTYGNPKQENWKRQNGFSFGNSKRFHFSVFSEHNPRLRQVRPQYNK